MKILEISRQFLARVSPLYGPRPGLADEVDKSRRAWQEALEEFRLVGPDMIDYVTYKIISAERRYMALLNQARADGITAWPRDLDVPPVRDSPEDPSCAPETAGP